MPLFSTLESSCIGTTVETLTVAPQTVQVLPSVRPVEKRVADTAGTRICLVCPLAGIVVCAVITVPQTEQCEPAVLPEVVQVAATAGSFTTVCAFNGPNSSVFVSLHNLHL